MAKKLRLRSLQVELLIGDGFRLRVKNLKLQWPSPAPYKLTYLNVINVCFWHETDELLETEGPQ